MYSATSFCSSPVSTHRRETRCRTWRISGLHAIAEGDDELVTEIEGGGQLTLTHDLLPREREIVVAGGLIRYLREEQPAPA